MEIIKDKSIKTYTVILVITGIIVYANSLFNAFVFDDVAHIINNPLMHSFANIPYFFKGSFLFNEANGQGFGFYYRPIPSIFYTFFYIFYGTQPFFYHLIQLLHIGNTIFVFLLFRKFIKHAYAFLCALVFLVHPINQETVVYISNLQDILFLFFGMLALLLSLKNFTVITTLRV